MVDWRSTRVRSTAIGIGAAIAGLGALSVLFTLSGIYNVAASRKHFDPTRSIIEVALRRSVWLHSLPVTVPPLDDRDLVALGASHYHGGCAPCHGDPGRPPSPIVLQMLPAPPDLRAAAPTWTTKELFWIVRHGLKFTGMPAWVAQSREDEVWAVVAFLRELPKMEPARYRALAMNADDAEPDQVAYMEFRGASDPIAGCVRCHGDENSPPASRLVPKLAGQSQTYLALALRFYAAGQRASGIMQSAVAGLDEAAMARIARHYANLPAVRDHPRDPKPTSDQVERGRVIAELGMPAEGIPPCLACHGAGTASFFPRLDGQNAPYLEAQLRLWQNGLRDRTAPGAIMAPIARRLSSQQIEDAAAFFASLEPFPVEGSSRGSAPTGSVP